MGSILIPGLVESSGLTFAPNGDLYVTGHSQAGIFHIDSQTFGLVRVIDTSSIALAGSWTLLVVPEPTSLGLLGMVGLTLSLRRQHNLR